MADVHDLVVVAVGSKLKMPGRIGEREFPAIKVLVAFGCLTKLPDVQDAGRRLEASDAFRPFAIESIGLEHAPEEVGPIDLGVVVPMPLPILVSVLLGTTWGTLINLLVTVLALGIPEGRILRGSESPFVSGAGAIGLGATWK